MSKTPPGYTNLKSIQNGVAQRKKDADRRRREIEDKMQKPKPGRVIKPGMKTSKGRVV